jgi:predicted LPLAT superfamily acyltransferase
MQLSGDHSEGKDSSQWTSRSIGSPLQHQFFYVLIRIGGAWLAYLFLYIVVSYYTLCRPSVRRKCESYLSRRFPDRKGFRRLLDSYRLSLELGKVLINRAIVGILGPDKISLTFDDKKELLKLVGEGKGIILLMAHIGCWQVALPMLSALNVPANLVIQREEGDIDKHYFEHRGIPCPYRIIDPRGYLGGSLEMIEVLKKGEALCIMGDRLLGSLKNTVAVRFLGEKALFPISAMKLAAASGAPVAILIPSITKPTQYRFDLAKVVWVPKGLGGSSDQFFPYINQFVKVLEDFVMENPYQFFNFYDMWGIDQ